ncbi:MAG: hypothetical protein VB050_04290 [Geobacteraceae bacterium]|nr:hypothetical protein [Geobacteraceae bacterium]
MVAGKPKVSAEVQATNDIYTIARERADQEIASLKEQQSMIAETYEVAGRIQAMTFIGKVATVATLIQLKKIKETKSYRDLTHVGTWEDYCNYLRLDRRTVDENLQNLNTFGEEFLETCRQFSLGYRDLRKLRQLTHDGSIQVLDGIIEIAGEQIPLDADHKEDLQAAIEKIIEEQDKLKEDLKAQKKAFDRVQDDTRKSVLKLQKENDQLQERAKARGLTLEEDAFITRVTGFRDFAQGALIALDPNAEENVIPDNLTIRMKSAIIASIHMIKMQVSAIYDSVIAQIGDPVMNPELLEDFTRWEKENGFNPNPQPTIKAAE